VAEPFQVSVTDAEIADLRERLNRTRWPDPETVDDWSQGVPLDYLRELCREWAEGYDFGFAARVNAFPQFKASIDGLGVHFLHVRSAEPGALPLVLTHGWPGSVLEFLDVIGPLTDPRAHGGDAADAFHVVVPSLPGFGWSDKPPRTGWSLPRIATAWNELMLSLGYERYGAQGGDWGSGVTNALAAVAPERLAGVHVNMAAVPMTDDSLGELTSEERQALEDLAEFRKTGTGYSTQRGPGRRRWATA
jgi:pimeloyl-ACP methyl ester carboxylesterase